MRCGFLAALVLFGCAGSALRAAEEPDEERTVTGGAGTDDEVPPRPPPPEASALDPDVACASDADCVLAPAEPCRCSPCGYVWRGAVNVARGRAIEDALALEECTMPECEPCAASPPPGGWVLGTGARCESGACRVE